MVQQTHRCTHPFSAELSWWFPGLWGTEDVIWSHRTCLQWSNKTAAEFRLLSILSFHVFELVGVVMFACLSIHLNINNYSCIQIPDVFPWGWWPCYFTWFWCPNYILNLSFHTSLRFFCCSNLKEYVWINDYDGEHQSTTMLLSKDTSYVLTLVGESYPLSPW